VSAFIITKQGHLLFPPHTAGLFFPLERLALPALLPAPLRWKAFDWRTWDRGTVFLGLPGLFSRSVLLAVNLEASGYILPSLPPLALLLGRSLAKAMRTRLRESYAPGRWASLRFLDRVWPRHFACHAVDFGTAWETGADPFCRVLLPALRPSCLPAAAAIEDAVQGDGLWAGAGGWYLGGNPARLSTLANTTQPRDIAAAGLWRRIRRGSPIVTYGYFHHTLHYYTGIGSSANIVDLPLAGGVWHGRIPASWS